MLSPFLPQPFLLLLYCEDIPEFGFDFGRMTPICPLEDRIHVRQIPPLHHIRIIIGQRLTF